LLTDVHIQPVAAQHAPSVQELIVSDPAIVAMTRLPDPYPHNGALHWIRYAQRSHEKGEEYSFVVTSSEAQVVGVCGLIISPDGRDGSATIRQDAEVYRLRLQPGETVTHGLKEGRGAWLQVAEGALVFNNASLSTGDGASTEDPGLLTFAAAEPTEALLFDLGP
jgi:redox-sensitive bicupin YhaK (pirin superfamily)